MPGSVTPNSRNEYQIIGPRSLIAIPGVRLQGDTTGFGPVDAASWLAPKLAAQAVPSAEELFSAPHRPAYIEGLRPFQVEGVTAIANRLQRDGGALLADDMGLGKSVQTLGVWNALERPIPLLIVCPASVRRSWKREVEKWTDVVPTLVETGAKAAKVTQADKIVITSYELVGKLPAGYTPHFVVMDEMHNLRGRKTVRGEALLTVTARARYRLGLTGTPMWSRPRDFYMLLKLLFGTHRFGNAEVFDYYYCKAFVNQWGGKDNSGISNSEELRHRLKYVMVRRTKAEIKDQMPAKTTQIHWVPGTKPAKQLFNAHVLGQVKWQPAMEATLAAKMDAVVELAVAATRSVVFTWMRSDAHAIAQAMRDEGLEVEVITGEDSHKERDLAVQRAQKTGASIVATLGAASTGINGMQLVASTVIFHAISMVPLEMLQAVGRVHRTGQTEPVTAIFVAMEDSMDRKAVEIVVDKLDQWTQTMGYDEASALNDAFSAPAFAASEAAALAAMAEQLKSEGVEDEDE
ncbi:MAG: DEAD/DEAH box helicase [Solirubrobacterales bacterium]